MRDTTREATAKEASAEGARAYRQGAIEFDFYKASMRLFENPHREGTLSANLWNEGWAAAQRLAELLAARKRPLYPSGKAPL